MKSISNLKRLGALILVGSVAVLTASASDTTTTAKHVAKHSHGWLGAMAKDSHAPAGRIHHSAPDVRLTKVFRGSPAYRAGLRSGDVIWKFDGMRLTSTAQLKHELRHEKAGEIVPVEIFHQGQREELNVRLGAVRTAHWMLRGTQA